MQPALVSSPNSALPFAKKPVADALSDWTEGIWSAELDYLVEGALEGIPGLKRAAQGNDLNRIHGFGRLVSQYLSTAERKSQGRPGHDPYVSHLRNAAQAGRQIASSSSVEQAREAVVNLDRSLRTLASARKIAHDESLLRAAGLMIITPQGEGLFLRYARDHDHGGEWGFPAGGLEGDEEPETAAIRETREETGWIPNETIKEVDSSQDEIDFTTFATVTGNQFIPELSDEHDSWCWAPLSNPPEPLHPGVEKTLGSLLAQDAEFKESEHPREEHGKFTSGSGGKSSERKYGGWEGKEKVDWEKGTIGLLNPSDTAVNVLKELTDLNLKDYKLPNGEIAKENPLPRVPLSKLTPAQEERARSGKGGIIREVDPNLLVSGQEWIKPLEVAKKTAKSPDDLPPNKLPTVVPDKHGKYRVVDGNHSGVLAVLMGHKLRVRDLSGDQDGAKDAYGANAATKSELENTIKFPPDKPPQASRAINIAYAKGGTTGGAAKQSVQANKFINSGGATEKDRERTGRQHASLGSDKTVGTTSGGKHFFDERYATLRQRRQAIGR
jgi:8-oxo-dGTP pyrophosphatase MutT (NUDIX family)